MANNTVIFGGDIAPSDASRELFREKQTHTLFTDILPVLKEADNVIVNLETVLTKKDLRIRKHGPNIKAPVEMAETLKEAGVTACGLANNHVYDFGITGLHDTFRAIDDAGMDRFGAGENEEEACRPYVFTAGDKKIAVIAVVEHEYTYAVGERAGAAPFDPFDTMVRIRDAKKEADFVVVMYHGGKEQCEYPSPRLFKAAHAFADLGADIVLCQHSHIIGTYECYKGSFILYGQGNFHFLNYMDAKGWTTGLLVKVVFDDTFHIDLIPIVSLENGMALAPEEEAKQMLNALEERSRSLADGSWIDGWNAFVEDVKDAYIETVAKAEGRQGICSDLQQERFAHYLDCEAHTDVFRTLYPTWHSSGEDGGTREE